MKTNRKLVLAALLAALLIAGAVYTAGAATARTPFTAYDCKYVDDGGQWKVNGSSSIVVNTDAILTEVIISDDDRVAGTATVLLRKGTHNVYVGHVTCYATYDLVVDDDRGWTGHSSCLALSKGPDPLINNTILQGTGELKGLTLHVMDETSLEAEERPDYCPDREGWFDTTKWEGYIIGATDN